MERTKAEETASKQEEISSSNLAILKKYHKEAFKFINEGLNLEDSNKSKEAIICYEKGLRTIEAAIKLPKEIIAVNTIDESKCNNIISKLESAQKEVKLRLEVLKEDSIEIKNIPTAPPLQGTSIYPSVPTDVVDNKDETSVWQDVKELLSVKEGVNLFHVDGTGDVSSWSSPCSLEVFQILKDAVDKVSPSAFIKCGEWVYPMEPGKSPVLKSKHRTYMFPDISLQQEATDISQISCIGVVLSDLVSDQVVNRFERVLSLYTDFRKEVEVEQQIKEKPVRPPPPRSLQAKELEQPSNGHVEQINARHAVEESRELMESRGEKTAWSDKISSGISIGSQWISWGMIKGAEYTSVLMEKGANNIRGRLTPNSEPTTVDPDLSRNMRQIHQATGSVVQISSFLINALATMTINLGKKMAPHVLYHGQKMLPEKYKMENNEGSQKKLEDVRKVAASGLAGFGLMFLALEQAGKNLYQTLSAVTVQTLQHKYGDEVGDVTQDAMGAAGNTVLAYWNVKKLGPKAIAKRAVKDTGKAIVYQDDNEIKTIK